MSRWNRRIVRFWKNGWQMKKELDPDSQLLVGGLSGVRGVVIPAASAWLSLTGLSLTSPGLTDPSLTNRSLTNQCSVPE